MIKAELTQAISTERFQNQDQLLTSPELLCSRVVPIPLKFKTVKKALKTKKGRNHAPKKTSKKRRKQTSKFKAQKAKKSAVNGESELS